jgi:hypothetical protein
MPGHNGIISFLLALAKTDRISKDVKLKSGRVGQVTTVEELAHYLGLRGGAGIRGREAKIAAHHQRAFADLFGFADDEECTYALQSEDDSAFRQAFTRMRERQKDAFLAAQPPIPRIVGALLEEDTDNRDQNSPSAFASLSLFVGEEASDPGTVYLVPDLVCYKVEMPDGITVTVKRAVLEFDLGQGETVRSRERWGAEAPLIRAGACFSVRGTSATRPSWLVVAIDGKDIGGVFDLPDDFIKVKSLAPGDIVRAYLGGDGLQIEIDLTFAFTTERPLTRLERKVAALLKRYEICSDESHGRRQHIAASMIVVKARVPANRPPTPQMSVEHPSSEA